MATTSLVDSPIVHIKHNNIDRAFVQKYLTPSSKSTDQTEEDDAAESAASESEENIDPAKLQEKKKTQAQKQAFGSFLKAHENILEVHAEKGDGLRKEVEPTSTNPIIDKVRRYQQELFEKALEENVIAVLDTGSGKTLIACLLVRHVLAEELIFRSQGERPRVICFLANRSVHLVQQQARVLANNLTTRPVVFVGDDKAEVWRDSKVWSELISRSTPVVCTPAVLQQCLDAALIRIDQISLLVFDEAHHAKKNHPYSRIIRSHYLQCELDRRPRIFGMTASPVDSKGDIDANMNHLEELLHCKIVTTHDPSSLSFLPKPTDVVWKYARLQPAYQTELYRTLWLKCQLSDIAKKGFVFAKEATSLLGPWCADRVWKHIIGNTEHEATKMVRRFEQSNAYENLASAELRSIAIRNLEDAIMLILDPNEKPPAADLAHLSSKVLRLHDELHKIYSAKPETHTIVFVDQRFTACVLNDCFTRLSIPNLRPGVLLGSAQDSTSLKKQEQFLDHFRVGLINLIFATSVADEGIDIPQCNLCVRFDLYKSPIQYMQSRGRARMSDSTYIHMIEEGNERQEIEFKYAVDSDKYIREYCEQLDPKRLLGRGTRLEKMIARDSTTGQFKTVTGAICDYDNSLLILSRFADSLHHIGALERESYEEEIDEVNKQFRYRVRLPLLSEVSVAGAIGKWKSNKALAKRSAAWNCCILLRKKGLLDDNLKSPFRKTKPDNLNARLAVNEKKSAYPMLVKPSAWQEGLGTVPMELYVSVIQLVPQRPLRRQYSNIAIFTRVLLPQFPAFKVYLEDAIETDVIVNTLPQAMPVSAQEVELLTKFTLDGVFLDVFNKVYETDGKQMSYWLAPTSVCGLTPYSMLTDLVDLDILQLVELGRATWSPDTHADGLWTNSYLVDPRNGMYRYFSKHLAPEFNIFDPVPDSVPKYSQKSRKNIIDFSDSYWKASKKHFAAAQYDPKQPVMKAELLTARRNFLEPGSDVERRQIDCLIAPQPLEVSRLQPDFAASCMMWPTIIHRLESYMITLEAFDKLELPGVPAALALEAFTKDSDSEDHQLQVHTDAKHGMGKNYERLEFIGDSLLKMMTTITVFNRTKCDEEGMHCRRMEILCNRRLFDVSTEKHHLYQYARTNSFNRSTWYPENVVLLKGRGAKKIPEPVKHQEISQDLGMKTIADISEAIIGAAITTSTRSENRFDLGIKAITTLVDSEDHTITSWSDIVHMYEAPEWSLGTNDVQANKLADEVAIRTGYTFRHPRLLRSAFTHSSDTQATVPDLQRLEFLGDAVLDWVSISWLFDNNPNRNPQWLTEHKMAMVSNKFLAALAVVLDFDKFIYCTTTKLYADITFYAKKVREIYSGQDTSRDFWVHIDSPPKSLSDLVESYLGAVLVDSGFDYSKIEDFFNKHVLWFFEDITQYDSFANRHPTTFLYKKVAEEFKCRDFDVLCADTDHGQVEPRVTAGVLIHNKVIASSTGASQRYARVRASQKALALMEGMTAETFRSTFGCHCRFKEE